MLYVLFRRDKSFLNFLNSRKWRCTRLPAQMKHWQKILLSLVRHCQIGMIHAISSRKGCHSAMDRILTDNWVAPDFATSARVQLCVHTVCSRQQLLE
mmetsp:Transcript_38181/g.92791  ORF Transcript_38181/g.92791 Transcript_38181/m.92791 type:complete len:97 (-) Transcript_38181:212-502(-)